MAWFLAIALDFPSFALVAVLAEKGISQACESEEPTEHGPPSNSNITIALRLFAIIIRLVVLPFRGLMGGEAVIRAIGGLGGVLTIHCL